MMVIYEDFFYFSILLHCETCDVMRLTRKQNDDVQYTKGSSINNTNMPIQQCCTGLDAAEGIRLAAVN